MSELVMRVAVDETRELVTGLWCPRCLLPSGVEVPIILESDGAWIRAGSFRACADCGEPILFEPEGAG